MGIYYIAYVLLLGVSIMSVNSKHQRKVICFSAFFLWVIIIGLRHPSMGVDLQYGAVNGYWGMYSIISKSSWTTILNTTFMNYEKGFTIFNKLLSYINEDPQFLLLVCALVAIGAVSYMIYKNSKSPLLSYIIYVGIPVFLINYSGLRQALAIAITMLSFQYIQDKKLLRFIISVIIATSFHSSAVVFLIAYPIYHMRTERILSKVGSILLILVVYMFRTPLYIFLTRVFRINEGPEINSSFTLFLFFVGIYIFCIFFEEKTNENEIGYRNLFYIACVCQAFSGLSNTAMRMGYYFMVYLVLLLPEVIFSRRTAESGALKSIKKGTIIMTKDSVIMYVVILFFFLAYGLYSLSKDGWAMTNPHSFFW